MKKLKAFTLIELLITIAIIGVLATLAIVSLQQARANARDAKRLADVRQMQTALELYFHDNSRYPAEEEFLTGSSLVSPTTGRMLMDEIPSAPAIADGSCEVSEYIYTTTEDGRSYEISFCTGKVVSDMPASSLVARPGGIYEYVDTSFKCGIDKVTDIDGNEYETVSIGGVCWMAENLKTTKYRDGSDIPNLIDNTAWSSDTEGSYSWPNNDETSKETYGALYNWYAATHEKGICPEGWAVPEHYDWIDVEIATCQALGNSDCETTFPYDSTTLTALGTNEGSSLAGQADLWAPRVGGIVDNPVFSSSNLNLIPVQYRNSTGTFYSRNNYLAYYWALDEVSSTSAFTRRLAYTVSNLRRMSRVKSMGMSVRCMDPSNKTYTVKYLAQEGGSILGETEQVFNEPGYNASTVTAVVDDPMYTFMGWSDGVMDLSRTDTDLQGRLSVTAMFQAPHTVTYLSDTGISISGETTQTVKHGEDASTVTAVVDDPGYVFAGWSDGVMELARSDTNISSSSTFTALSRCGNQFTDIRDGNTYNIVQIGDQCWMAENLKYLPVVHNNAEFEYQGNNKLPGYGVYGYDGSDVATAKAEPNYSNYGVLYNWPAAMNGSTEEGAQGACPDGWHIPSDGEWGELLSFLGSGHGRKLKSERTEVGVQVLGIPTNNHPRWDYFNNSSYVGTNEFGFNALPAGSRSGLIFGNLGSYTSLWSSSVSHVSGNTVWYRVLAYFWYSVNRNSSNSFHGFSVRCLKN